MQLLSFVFNSVWTPGRKEEPLLCFHLCYALKLCLRSASDEVVLELFVQYSTPWTFLFLLTSLK
jgi:hypothetical protein